MTRGVDGPRLLHGVKPKFNHIHLCHGSIVSLRILSSVFATSLEPN
jgi:hypothetical protein